MFSSNNVTRHLTLITDALPTKGAVPEEEAITAVARAVEHNITISVIGIQLDEKGEELARKITDIGKGKLYRVRNLDELGAIVIDDYEAIS